MNCLDYLIMEVIDNFDTITTKKEKEIYNNLTEYFDDDTIYYCENGGRYFIDDLIGKVVQVGNSIFVVKE